MTMTDESVCESCYDAVVEAAMTVGEDYDDPERVARTLGGQIFDHFCEADEDDDIECNCGCQRG